ncbi:MAG: hypothetical protein ACPGO4_01055 [Flavobacteriaceae bacterium]
MPKSLYLLTLCLCFGSVTIQSTQKTAAVLGVYIHGRAADNFVKRYPKPLLTVALLPDLLAPVIHELEQDNMS